MRWRNHNTHAEETRAVKAALLGAGIPYHNVTHGTGTAWAWLHIYLGSPEAYNLYSVRAMQIAKHVTGRKGDYDGEILVLAQ